MDNASILFDSIIRVSDMSCFDKCAVWPKNIEVTICRVPVRVRDGYSIDMVKRLAKQLKNNMVKNGAVFLVCYAPMECRWRPFEIGKVMCDEGFTHVDNIVMQKTWYPGKRSEVNLVNSHEYILYFCNGNQWRLDRDPIVDYLGDADVSCPGNTWKVNTGSLDESYPVDLAGLLIKMTDCLPGSIVFDPFGGSSSPLQACLKLGHSFYGFETDGKKLNRYKRIIRQFEKESGR